MVFSCTALKTACPIRFAGTCKQYSKKAIPQLITMTKNNGEDLYFKCPYHAKVIKIFEQTNKKMVVAGTDVIMLVI